MKKVCVLSKYEQFIADRDRTIIDKFKELTLNGANRMAAYRIIGDQMVPPLHDTAVMRILRRHGLNTEPATRGRKMKSTEQVA
jgi:hypothetical protein